MHWEAPNVHFGVEIERSRSLSDTWAQNVGKTMILSLCMDMGIGRFYSDFRCSFILAINFDEMVMRKCSKIENIAVTKDLSGT